jgi:membrane protease YdiL (CAAX protease family)
MTPDERGSTRPVPLLRAAWRPALGNGVLLAAVLAALAAVVRGVGMLGPRRLFWILPVGFVLMALTPHIFLSREGRRRAGFRLPRRPLWILWGLLLGALAAVLCYWLGVTLFGDTPDNWFVSVRGSFPVRAGMGELTTAQIFWIVSIPSLIFSPLGEEIFFRGFLQQVVEERSNHRRGVLVDAGCFALVHLFHHGIQRLDGGFRILPISGALWMALIFGVGVLFAFLRRRTGSLAAPIVSHAAFNLTMNFAIFYWL